MNDTQDLLTDGQGLQIVRDVTARTSGLEVLPVSDFRFPLAYGWADFHNDGWGGLSLVDHAKEYGLQGIFADTTRPIPIPEPNSVALISGVALLTLAMRCRKKSQVTSGKPFAEKWRNG